MPTEDWGLLAKRHSEELTAALARAGHSGANVVHIVIDDDWLSAPGPGSIQLGTNVPPPVLHALFKHLALRYAPRNTEDRKHRA